MPRAKAQLLPLDAKDSNVTQRLLPADWHEAVAITQSQRTFFLTKMTAAKLTKISYASIRRQSDEDGAVQRILNTRRIASLKAFALSGGDYPSSVILNWVDNTHSLQNKDGNLFIPSVELSAQIIDGQHRIAGLREAIKENEAIGAIEIPVSIYDHLGTPGCAAIFLSINTEQRPVPRSLVIDLYGEVGQTTGDAASDRARDIVMMLNTTEDSPYKDYIKLPGATRSHGGIALSTAFAAIKPLVQDKGVLENYNIKELETQFRVILNFFSAIQSKYGDSWHSTKENAFLFGAGFTGAIEFLQTRLLPYCGKHSDFRKEFIEDALNFDSTSLIRPSDTTGRSGRDAISTVSDLLKDRFTQKAASTSTIRI